MSVREMKVPGRKVLPGSARPTWGRRGAVCCR